MLQEARDVGVIIKYYPDGSLFVIMFSDGTGTVYYPSGRIAITISAVGTYGDFVMLSIGNNHYRRYVAISMYDHTREKCR